MQVSTVSPPPTSPTEADDLCGIDVTNMAIDGVTLLICLCGLAGNGAVLWLLGLKDRIVRIFYLAVAEFLFLLLMVPSALLFLVENVSCSPIMPVVYMRILFLLAILLYYCGLLQLTAFRYVKGVYKTFKLCCRSHLLRDLSRVVLSVQRWAFFILFIAMPMVTLVCPSHEQEYCQAALTYVFAITVLLFAGPLVISSTILFNKAKCGSQQQKPERLDIVIFLIVPFALLFCLWNLLQQLGYIVVSSQVFLLLTCINSSIKPFIYFLVGSWRPCSVGSLRASLRRVFEEPEENTPIGNDVTRDTVI